ncbi:MAG: hypothetical protein ACKOQ8_00310 [Micrococcales bacterium]
MKLIGKRLMLWSLVTIFISTLGNFASLNSSPIGNLGSVLVETVGGLAWLGLMVGAILYFIGKNQEPKRSEVSGAKFWIGAALVLIGIALPGFCVYEMFQPGGGDAIFLLMEFGPIGLALIIGGAVMMSRNRQSLRSLD